MPDVADTPATVGPLLLHVPPATVWDNIDTFPEHKAVLPVMG